MGRVARKGRNDMYDDEWAYDRWLLACADESAKERYLPDDYEPKTVVFTVWWESESADCEDDFKVEVENSLDRKKWATIEAMEEIKDNPKIPDDAVITEMWEDWY